MRSAECRIEMRQSLHRSADFQVGSAAIKPTEPLNAFVAPSVERSVIVTRFALGLCILGLGCAMFSGCAHPAASTSSAPSSASKSGAESDFDSVFVFKTGDLVVVTIRRSHKDETLGHAARISEDGTFDLPSLGRIVAAGKTPDQLRAEIRAKVGRQRLVSVIPPICCLYYYVEGEVNDPGPRPHVPGLTVSEAVKTADGFTKFADRRRITLLRGSGKEMIINLAQSGTNDVKVLPDDRIFVSRRRWWH